MRLICVREKLAMRPSVYETIKETKAETIKILIDLKNTFKLKMVSDREIDRIGDKRGATNIPPIVRIILFFNKPIVTIKVESTISK